MPKPQSWLKVTPHGLFCMPGDFYLDPIKAVPKAIVTHGHADHARPGHEAVIATPETIEIAKMRMGNNTWQKTEALQYGRSLRFNGVDISLEPAGHVIGSAQIVLTYEGSKVVVSGDYKRRQDPTCLPFKVVQCDTFITEATFALPVFRHPDDHTEIKKLLASLERNPDRTHLIGAYALGKAQRVIALLRKAGYQSPIFLHGAINKVCNLYKQLGVPLGELKSVSHSNKKDLVGQIVIAPPSATRDRWSRRFTNPIICFASGWMQIRQRARQRGVELPLIISDHADWDELTQTVVEVAAPDIWVTHGREEALIHYAETKGIRARALSMIGYEEQNE